MHAMEESQMTFSLMGPAKSTNRNHRLNLPCWGALILAVARRAYGRFETINGPIGSLARGISFVAGPICYLIQCQWLAILALIDDQIAAIENAIESTFPFTTHIFDKIDWLVAAPEREEELIVVDISCDEKPVESKVIDELRSTELDEIETVVESKEGKVKRGDQNDTSRDARVLRPTAMDEIEAVMESKEGEVKGGDWNNTSRDAHVLRPTALDKIKAVVESKEGEVKGTDRTDTSKDARVESEARVKGEDEGILKLFDVGWHMKVTNVKDDGKKGN